MKDGRSFPDVDDDAPREAADEIERLRGILRAILHADERGQGQPFAEAMDAAVKAVGWGNRGEPAIETACLRSVATSEPCQPRADNLRLCTICGFTVDLTYAAEKPRR